LFEPIGRVKKREIASEVGLSDSEGVGARSSGLKLKYCAAIVWAGGTQKRGLEGLRGRGNQVYS
jgi:hypothetical protein